MQSEEKIKERLAMLKFEYQKKLSKNAKQELYFKINELSWVLSDAAKTVSLFGEKS